MITQTFVNVKCLYFHFIDIRYDSYDKAHTHKKANDSAYIKIYKIKCQM